MGSVSVTEEKSRWVRDGQTMTCTDTHKHTLSFYNACDIYEPQNLELSTVHVEKKSLQTKQRRREETRIEQIPNLLKS